MNESRKIIIRGFMLLIAAVYLIKLLYIQVFDDSYATAADNNAIVKEIQIPYRGQIYDRQNKLIVSNTPIFDLYITPRKARVQDTARFCAIFGITKSQFDSLAKTAREYSKVKPSVFLRQLSMVDLARVQDVMVDYPGFSFQKNALRTYTSNSMANSLGYISEINEKQLEAQDDDYYQQGDYIGQSGIEKQYEPILRGQRGVKFKMVDVHGVEKGAFKGGKFDTIAVMGQNLITSIDLATQQYADSLMKNKVGSIVAIEPSTGEILTLVSAPTYDPNLLSGRNFSKYYSALANDPTRPLINRPMQALYRPGSTFKTIQALIALQEGVITPSTTFPCGGAPVKCHNHQRSYNDLHNAIEWSCNPYFYNVFKKIIYNNDEPNVFKKSALGLKRWNELAKGFGIGQILGVDLPYERRGSLPDVASYDKRYKGENTWKFSNIYSLSIGEGELDISPMKMANVTAIIANRGYYIIPHVVKGIGKVGNIDETFKEKHYTEIDRKHFSVVIEGMKDAVNRGTVVARAQIPDIQMCGKTGTSQNGKGKKDHSIFIAFAPKENPKIAVAVFVENGGFGGVASAPIASLVIEKYLKGHIERKGLETETLNKSYLAGVSKAVIQPVKKDTTHKKPVVLKPNPLSPKAAGQKPLLGVSPNRN